jgi:hypothetical protein
MNNELVGVLDSYGEDLLRHVDNDNELSVQAVEYVCNVANDVLEGSLDWEHARSGDWYALTDAFVQVYGMQDLEEMMMDASLGEDRSEVTGLDRLFLNNLLVSLEEYLARRREGHAPFRLSVAMKKYPLVAKSESPVVAR